MITEKEMRVATAKIYVQRAESEYNEAVKDLGEGYKKLQAEFEQSYAKLKGTAERKKMDLDQQKVYLELAEADLERGFDTT